MVPEFAYGSLAFYLACWKGVWPVSFLFGLFIFVLLLDQISVSDSQIIHEFTFLQVIQHHSHLTDTAALHWRIHTRTQYHAPLSHEILPLDSARGTVPDLHHWLVFHALAIRTQGTVTNFWLRHKCRVSSVRGGNIATGPVSAREITAENPKFLLPIAYAGRHAV